MWKGVNLEKELQRERSHQYRKTEDRILEVFRNMLKEDDERDEQVLDNIFGSGNRSSELNIDLIDPDRIYHTTHIRKLCTQFRLRFLDAKHFKAEIPREAIAEIKRLQKKSGEELKGFKVLAPAPMFNLRYKDKDPLLFLSLGNDRYYLIHKWGKDMNPFRKLLVFPFRNFKSLLASVAGLAFLIVMSIPDSVMMGPYDNSSAALRVIFFFYLFIAFSGLTALYGFSRVKNFNSTLWDSKYID